MDDDAVSGDPNEVWSNEKSNLINEYPDLDYVPKYPWLGEPSPPNDHHRPLSYELATRHNDIIQHSQDNSSRQGLASKGPDHPGNGSLNPFPLPSARRDPNDLSFDPDFQFSEECTAYVSREFMI